MPFGAPGFYRDHPTTRKPVQLDITFVYENLEPSAEVSNPPIVGDRVASAITDPAVISTFNEYLLREGIGDTSYLDTDNNYSASNNRVPWVNIPWNPVSPRQTYAWSTPGSIITTSIGVSGTRPAWKHHQPTAPISAPPGPSSWLGADIRDVTGGAYWLATKDPRESAPPGAFENVYMPYRPGVSRLMASFSYYQTTLTEQARVVAAMIPPNEDHTFIGINSLRFAHTAASPGVIILGVVLYSGSSRVVVVSSYGGELFYTEAPLSGLTIEYGSAGNTATNTVTQYTTMTQAQITNGPVQLPGSTFQLANTPHMAYKTGGAVFDISQDMDDIFEALAVCASKYLYTLT